ncbi:hypothetical protein [Picosynechococcus sp. PCC 7003]|uniref:hypothetical protein n=1 Tax=Picosynechococcus sp. PCC 7003 TaxID=374981 RepID=UPI0012ED1D47|nr:hypothetical protein [Picosynechococcus sp. PCC 7003]
MCISKALHLGEINPEAIALCPWLPSQAMRLYNKGYVENHGLTLPSDPEGLPLNFP